LPRPADIFAGRLPPRAPAGTKGRKTTAILGNEMGDMDTLEAIRTRRSIRKYLDRPVPEELIQRLLAAAMQAPSARNQQPWQFVVIDDRAMLAKIPPLMPNAAMAGRAPLAILVCGDLSLEKSEGYWAVDCAAAVENMLLAAHALGLGAVWCGVYPREPRMDALRRLVGLPENVVAHSLVVLGYAAEQVAAEDRYRPDRVRRNGW
jgi:nitroreductase